MIVGFGNILVFIVAIIDQLVIRIGLLVRSGIEVILHLLLWHVDPLLRRRGIVFHHIISCGPRAGLLIVLNHAFVVSELDATGVVIKIDVDVVIVVVCRVGRRGHLHVVFGGGRVERGEAGGSGHVGRFWGTRALMLWFCEVK